MLDWLLAFILATMMFAAVWCLVKVTLWIL